MHHNLPHCVTALTANWRRLVIKAPSGWQEEAAMTRFKHEGNSDPASRRAVFVSLGLIAALLASYWALAEWTVLGS